MMICPTRGDPKLICLDTTMSSSMPVWSCKLLGEQVWLHPFPHLTSTQTGSRLSPSWYPPHNCTLSMYTQTSLHLPLPPKLGPASPHSPDKHCSSIFSLDFPSPARSWAGSPGWVPTATDTVACCSWPDEFGDTQAQLGIRHRSVGTQILSSTFWHMAKHRLAQFTWSAAESHSRARGSPSRP